MRLQSGNRVMENQHSRCSNTGKKWKWLLWGDLEEMKECIPKLFEWGHSLQIKIIWEWSTHGHTKLSWSLPWPVIFIDYLINHKINLIGTAKMIEVETLSGPSSWEALKIDLPAMTGHQFWTMVWPLDGGASMETLPSTKDQFVSLKKQTETFLPSGLQKIHWIIRLWEVWSPKWKVSEKESKFYSIFENVQ